MEFEYVEEPKLYYYFSDIEKDAVKWGEELTILNLFTKAKYDIIYDGIKEYDNKGHEITNKDEWLRQRIKYLFFLKRRYKGLKTKKQIQDRYLLYHPKIHTSLYTKIKRFFRYIRVVFKESFKNNYFF